MTSTRGYTFRSRRTVVLALILAAASAIAALLLTRADEVHHVQHPVPSLVAPETFS